MTREHLRATAAPACEPKFAEIEKRVRRIVLEEPDLDDIPRYWQQAQRLHLPVIQYTAREMRSGLLFWAFAQARSASATAVFASRIQLHLHRYGVGLWSLRTRD